MSKVQRGPHESTKANIIKGTLGGLYYERDAESSQRAPLERDQAVTSFYYVKRFILFAWVDSCAGEGVICLMYSGLGFWTGEYEPHDLTGPTA